MAVVEAFYCTCIYPCLVIIQVVNAFCQLVVDQSNEYASQVTDCVRLMEICQITLLNFNLSIIIVISST